QSVRGVVLTETMPFSARTFDPLSKNTRTGDASIAPPQWSVYNESELRHVQQEERTWKCRSCESLESQTSPSTATTSGLGEQARLAKASSVASRVATGQW